MAKFPWAKPMLFGDESELVADAIESSWISGGPYVERFERAVLGVVGARCGAAVSNGTTALHLALLGLGIGPGDEVIVPAYTFVAAANMVMAVGAKPVYADVEAETWLLDPVACGAAVTPRTRAIIAVHLYGNVADMAAIMAVAETHGLAVIEDAAEAFGTRLDGRYAGTIGTVGTYSFQATKTITTGEGGMVVCGDAALAETLYRIRDHGMVPDRRYWHDRLGFNFRLTNVAAAMGCAQIGHLDEIIAARRRLHAAYERGLGGIPGLRLQKFASAVEPVLWALALRLTEPSLVEARERIMADLAGEGIETRPGFYDLAQLPPYDCPALPVARAVSRSVLSLPTYVALSDDDVAAICASLGRVLAGYR